MQPFDQYRCILTEKNLTRILGETLATIQKKDFLKTFHIGYDKTRYYVDKKLYHPNVLTLWGFDEFDLLKHVEEESAKNWKYWNTKNARIHIFYIQHELGHWHHSLTIQ